MRGLEEIRKVNENPTDYDAEEHFGTKHVGVPYTYGEEVADAIIDDIMKDQRPKTSKLAALEALAGLVVLDALTAERPHSHFTHMDRIQPGIDQPPFVEFWANLNASREAHGLPEALYKEARTLFNGGETPVGAMTFIGKQWDGLRAVPAEPVKYLGGARPAYHGQYRQTTRLGVKWHTVKDHGQPKVFRIPEEAVTEAEKVRNYRVANHDGFKS